MSSMKKLELPAFQAAMEEHKALLSTGTYYRWRAGIVPDFVYTVAMRPGLALALAQDLQQYATQPPTDPPSSHLAD